MGDLSRVRKGRRQIRTKGTSGPAYYVEVLVGETVVRRAGPYYDGLHERAIRGAERLLEAGQTMRATLSTDEMPPPVVPAEVARLRQVVADIERERDEFRERAERVETELHRAHQELAQLGELLSRSCVEPLDGCECAGCTYARAGQ